MYEYYKCKLNLQSRMIYEILLNNINKLAFVGRVQFTMPYNECVIQDTSDAYSALRLDRPEYYFLGHSIQITAHLNGVITIQHNLKYSKSHIIRMNRVLRRTIQEFIQDTMNSKPIDRERAIYCKVGKEFIYKDGPYSHDLSGLLVFKNGVCESLAGMLVVALREAGISAAVVHGYAHGECHRWCKICIDNKEYYADVTWDMHNCKLGMKLKYFNLTYDQMSKDHKLVEDIRVIRKLSIIGGSNNVPEYYQRSRWI